MSASVMLRLGGEVVVGMVAVGVCTMYATKRSKSGGFLFFWMYVVKDDVVKAFLGGKNVSSRCAKDIFYLINIALISDQLS